MRDPSSLLRHGALLIFGNLCGAACNAAFHMVAGRHLFPPEYASLSALLGIILATSTPMMAVQNTVAHYVARFRQSGDGARVAPFVRRWVLAFLALALAIAAAGILGAAPLGRLLRVHAPLAAIAMAVLGFSLLMPVGYGWLQGEQRFTALAWIPQAWGSTRFLLTAAAIWFLGGGRSFPAAVPMLAQGAGVAAVLLLLLLARRPDGHTVQRPNGPTLQRSNDRTLPYALASLLALSAYAVLAYLDITLARHLFPGDLSTDLFAKAATIARTAIFLPQPLALALFPKVASDGSLPPGSARLLVRAAAVSALLALAALAACCLLPWLPWAILYGPADPARAPLAFSFVRSMALALCPLAVAYPLLQFALAQRRFSIALRLLLPAALYLGALFILKVDALSGLSASLAHLPALLLSANVLALLLLLPAALLR